MLQKVRALRDSMAVKALTLGALVVPMVARADTTSDVFDPTAYVTQITGTIPGLLLVGGASFAVVLAIRSTKWGKRAL